MKSWEYRNLPISERILTRITCRDDGCHIFEGAKDSDGYGRVKLNGVGIAVHRWMYEHNFGAVPQGNHVLHKCDTPACVNPEHLFLGTHAENMADKAAKGRSKNVPIGHSHKRPMAKINDEKAKQIKELLRRGYRQADIARDFGVSRNLISEISLGKTWRHIE